MITMLQDFRGRASGERYFKEGEIVELPEEFESAMVAEGVAKRIVSEMQMPEEEKPKKVKK